MADKRYKIEEKREGILPMRFQGWRSHSEDLSFEEVQRVLRQTSHHILCSVTMGSGSTIFGYESHPHWNSEKWDKFRGDRAAGAYAPNPIEKNFIGSLLAWM